ncbi:MAG: hypothetical protein JNL11_12010 [Bdellovibrionaceae bacterium]|nr:hypothetical protein [Pseudobdellovibrionaceae bacterium]
MKIVSILMFLSLLAQAGGSFVGNAGDWFVRTMPLLKFQLPEDFGVVEGVQYKRVGLRKCTAADLQRLKNKNDIPDKINTIYLPDRNWHAYRVLLENAKYLVCSLGLASSDSAQALQLLVNNEDTNRILYMDTVELGRQIKYSKSNGALTEVAYRLPAIGSFLTNLDPKGVFIGYNLQDGLRVLGSPRSIYFRAEAHAHDFVYIPQSIQDRDRAYFVQTVVDNSPNPVWRLILPVAFSKNDFPLYTLADALRKTKGFGPVVKAFFSFKIDTYVEEHLVKFSAWSSFSETPTSKRLRNELATKFDLPYLVRFNDHQYLAPKFQLKFVPSIVDGKLNHAAFVHGENFGEIILPSISQQWRVGADVVHELVHALQEPCPMPCSVDRRFEMEMEAHQIERVHIEEMIKEAPETKYASDAFNYLVAASLPNVEWSTTLQSPIQKDLCTDVIEGYQFDVRKISDVTLKKFDCLDQIAK